MAKKKLLIVESPAKVKTIGKFVGDDYKVMASIGHVRDLPKSSKDAIDIENGFVPNYVVVEAKKKVIQKLNAAARGASEVILATDYDREGEAIAWHLKEALNLENPRRIVFNEITEEAVQEALDNPRDIDENLRKAQEARRVLDRIVGYGLSGLIWKKVRYGLSAGRVQSPALRIIMEREREIRAFHPEDFWVITADVEGASGPFTLTCVEEPRDEEEVKRIVSVGQKEDWVVSAITRKEKKRQARPPFITSTLQQAASTRLGFSPSRTMRLAQGLYEAGHITYMRTDSTALAKQAMAQIESVVEKEYGKEYVEVKTFAKKRKDAQEAHEAIRPTNAKVKKAGSTKDEKKLYELIWSRAIASQMKAAIILQSKLVVTIGDGSVPDFAATGSLVKFDGWLKADPASRGDDVEIPIVEEQEELKLKEIHTEAKQTRPPSRYTEAGLIKELEKRGIGRPSTYASTVGTLINRSYLEKEGRTLIPTDTGDVVSSFLEENFDTYVSDTFTAELEDELDKIAGGTQDYESTLTTFYEPFKRRIEDKESIDKITSLGDAPKEFKCPKCGANMIIKLGRDGKFMSCSKFPDCDGARSSEGEERRDAEPIGEDPESGQSVFLLFGKYGPYVQLGEKTKENKKPRRASVPKGKEPDEVTLDEALKYLTLPRLLGVHPDSEQPISASIGRFGPYVVHEKDFRSLKTDDVYTIELSRALEIFKEPKKTRRRGRQK